MRFFKVIFASLLGIFAVIFIIQNKEVLEHALQLRLNLYLTSFQSPQTPVWILILFAFFLGVFTASIYGIYELLKQRQTIRQLRQSLEIMEQKIKRGGSIQEGAARPSVPPAAPQPD